MAPVDTLKYETSSAHATNRPQRPLTHMTDRSILLIESTHTTQQTDATDMSTTKTAPKQETRTALLEVGLEIMQQKGYSNTGIQEILNALGVPKGSFYHYFDSKETYAIEIIRHYDQHYSAQLLRMMRNPKETPIQRLRSYCEDGKAKLAAKECRHGCFIGSLSQEMSDQSERLRQELSQVVRKWRDMVSACIAEGQEIGEIKKSWTPDAAAELFLSGWSGAVMRTKTVKDTEPLEVFIKLMFEDVLKP